MPGNTEPPTGYVSRIATALAAVFLIAGAPSLVLAESDASTGDIELTGRLVDEDTGEPVPNTTLVINNRGPGPDEDTRRRLQTGPDGSFNTSLSAGQVFLFVHDLDGYKDLRASFEIRNDTHVELPLLTGDEDPGTIEVRVVDAETGRNIPDAHVRASANPQDVTCKDEPCRWDRPGTDRRERTVTDNAGDEVQVELVHRSRLDPYQSDRTDDEGRVRFQVPPGTYEIRARADEHLDNQTTTTVAANETKNVSIALTPLPERTVELSGQVTEEGSGDGIPYAEIEVTNQKWGTHAKTRADEDGRYEISVRPGYVTFRVEADKHYRAPCPEAGSDERSDRDAGIPEGRGEPCPAQERETRFFAFADTFRANASESSTIDVQLGAPAAPNASLDGWVVNATTGEAIESASVTLHSQWTTDRGLAETGENGSFQIPIRSGPYVVRVSVDGYYDFAQTIHVPEDGERVTFELEPGEPLRGGCCRGHVVTSEPRSTGSSAAGDDAGGSGSSSQGSGTSSESYASDEAGAQAEEGSSLAFQGGPGDLGPPPTAQDDSGDRENAAPAVGALLVSTVLSLGAVLFSRRDP